MSIATSGSNSPCNHLIISIPHTKTERPLLYHVSHTIISVLDILGLVCNLCQHQEEIDTAERLISMIPEKACSVNPKEAASIICNEAGDNELMERLNTFLNDRKDEIV